MICILAGSKLEAERFAKGQELKKEEWFFGDEYSILVNERISFHVLRLPGFWELPKSYLDRINSMIDQRS